MSPPPPPAIELPAKRGPKRPVKIGLTIQVESRPLAVAMAQSSIAVEPAQQHAFVTVLLARWGEAVSGPVKRRGARR